MIIWSGWGFLVAVFTFGASLAMELLTETMTGDSDFYQREPWPLALALVLAGALTWVVGKTLNDRATRTSAARHTFFFMPMHYWAAVRVALALLPFVLR
jgi:drug/metabolite transporter (DMT)-like permease